MTPSHQERVRASYLCKVCGQVTIEPHVEHFTITIEGVPVRYPKFVGIMTSLPEAVSVAKSMSGRSDEDWKRCPLNSWCARPAGHCGRCIDSPELAVLEPRWGGSSE